MKNSELEKTLRKYSNGCEFITQTQLLTCFGISNPSGIKRALSGIDPINNKYYYIGDVSRALLADNARRGE